MDPGPYNFILSKGTPIVRLVDEMIDRADKSGASDIHIDPRVRDVQIRFRIDGVLNDVCTLPLSTHGEFVARIKIMAGLRIDERVIPQDGRLTVGNMLDVRVTTVASYYGESIVMRLLRRTAKASTLEALGFSSAEKEKISEALKCRQGLIVLSGPTGSGKTTTLYSLLSLISDSSLSTVTIEDPVEYAIDGARQIHVQQKRGINFANGLRSILRQDPDVIMVGEMRDHETAAIAVSAALTGHLVLSTLHTNDAVSTVVRFMEMGIEPYLVAGTLRLVISQRLVRKLCVGCREVVQIGVQEIALLQKYAMSEYLLNGPTFFKAKGCVKCCGTGYLGRTVVSEILPVSGEICRLIVEKQPTLAIKQLALMEGMQLINKAILLKCIEGITSFEEAVKIIHA